MKKFFTVMHTKKMTSKTLISITLMFCALLCSNNLHALSAQRATISSISSSIAPATSGDIYGENLDYLKAGNDNNSNPPIKYGKNDGYAFIMTYAGNTVTFTINLNAKFRVTSANLCGVIWISSGPSWRGVKDISMKYKLNSGDAWTTATNIVVTDNGGGNNTAGWRGLVDVNPTDFTAQYIQITVKGAAPCVGLSGIRIIGVPFQTLTIKKNNGEADQTMDHWWTGNTQISDPTRTGYRFGGWLQTKTAYSASWAQVFYHYNENGTILFSASDDLGTISINDVDRFSIFNVLDKLKYDNTNYEFLLEYASRPGQYNRWKQTSNPATTYNAVTGYSPVQISWTANYWRGLAVSHLRGQFTFIDGSQEGTEKWFYALGGCYVWSGGIPACHETTPEKDHVRLWVRTNDDLSNIGNSLTAPLASDALTADNKYVFRPENATIKAIWIPNRYTVTYNGNGATGGSTANSSHTYDVFHTLTTNGFTKTGYTFSGWATSASGAIVYTNGQSVANLTAENNATITLYAKWTPNTYTITYDGNGATGGSTANSLHTYNDTSALTPNGFTLANSLFLGWSTTPTGEIEYTDGQNVINLTEENYATIPLYAQWGKFYRLYSDQEGGDNDFISNVLFYDGHFSLYHPAGNTLKLQRKDINDNWRDVVTLSCDYSNTVIKTQFDGNAKTVGAVSEYTGNFFVRTEAASGGMDEHLNPYMDNKMTLLTGTTKYYWAKQVNPDPEIEMRTIIGNLYNSNISASVCDDKVLNDTSAIRINYERTTNEVKIYQAKDEIVSLGTTNATIDSLMQCTFMIPALAEGGGTITSTANVEGINALATAFNNTTLTGKRTRIVYDFATDSVFYSYLPEDEMENIDIANSDLVIVATDEETQTLFNPFYIINGRVIYERTFSNNKIWYWISLPYDVKISDVQGIPHYGTAWIMKKYNTQARANLSWGNDTTYWEILPVTATLNAHEGYLLGFENNYPMPALLKFPSDYYNTTTTLNTTTDVTLPNYTGTHEDKNFDANWHLVGTPLYSASTVTGPAYIVTINANNTGYIYDRSADTTNLDPFKAFLVQYAGEENFTKQAQSAPSPAPLLQKATNENVDEYYELAITSPTYTEKTGIIMASDGSINLYELNKDLLLLGAWGENYPQLFTFGAKGKKMAFNHIAKATQTVVQVGLYVGEAETYTFSLNKKDESALSVILNDKLLDKETDLLLNDYTFDATIGEINDRFELTINRKADEPTGILNTTNNAVLFTQTNGKLTISGVELGTDIRLFDMTGRCIHQSKAQEINILHSLPSGVYTAVVGTKAHKIVVK